MGKGQMEAIGLPHKLFAVATSPGRFGDIATFIDYTPQESMSGRRGKEGK